MGCKEAATERKRTEAPTQSEREGRRKSKGVKTV